MPLGFQIRVGYLAVMWWAKPVPLVVIGLTELPNSGWAKAHSAHPLAAALYCKTNFENHQNIIGNGQKVAKIVEKRHKYQLLTKNLKNGLCF